MSADHHHRHALTGLAFALAGYALMSVGDGVVKTMAGQWPGTAIALLRYIVAVVLLAGLLFLREGRTAFSFPDRLIHWGRGAAVAVGSTCFFMAVGFMPLAEATVIQFASPIITALLSAMILHERAPRAAWVATAIAFAGVVVVIRPNIANVGLAGLLPLGTAFCMSCTVLLNRRVAGRASALKMQYLMALTAVPVLAVITALGMASGLPQLRAGVPDWSVVIKCAAVAVSASLAHGLLYMATERVPAATMAPVTYVQLLVAVVLGAIFFNNHPDRITAIGSALIILAGLILWRSQMQLMKQRQADWTRVS